ncbi:hypothetical protein DIPPA_61699 [Diplonema papillatum]|nr:hypothetical protein DIPPA_61699 [Diplonema papillatum]
MNDLPRDVIRSVMLFIDNHKTLCVLSEVCKLWRAVARHSDEIWQKQCEASLPTEDYKREIRERELGQAACSWHGLYKMWYQQTTMRKVSQFVYQTVSSTHRGSRSMQVEKSLEGLVGLDLSNTCLGERGAVHLSEALKGGTRLEKLVLSNQLFGTEGLSVLVPVFCMMPCLRDLNVSGNRLGPDTGDILRPLLVQGTVHRLELQQNFLRCQGAMGIADGLLAPGRDLTPSPRKLYINLDQNELKDEGFRHIIRAAGNLQALSCRKNGLSSLSAKEAARFLPACPATFVSLDLSNSLPASVDRRGDNNCFSTSAQKFLKEKTAETANPCTGQPFVILPSEEPLGNGHACTCLIS